MTIGRIRLPLSSLLLCIVALFTLAACGNAPVLNGLVLDQYSQQPIAGATVVVGKNTVTTDDKGAWQVTGWQSTDSVSVQATDYATATLALTDYKPDGAQPVTVSLDLRPNTLQGVLIDQYTQQPISGAAIQTTSGLTATTGADGTYKLVGVPETFDVTISAPHYADVQQSVERATSLDATLRPTLLTGTLTDKYSSKPIAGATVATDSAKATTDAEGRYTLEPVAPNQELLISATDYTSQTVSVPEKIELDVVLRPSTVRGTVVNAETGQPVDRGAVIAMPPQPGSDASQPFRGDAVALTRLNADGTYTLNNVPENAQIQVLAPGYRKSWTNLSEGEFNADLKVEPFEVRAIYVTAATASSKDALTELFDLVDQTELNAMVIDIKLDIAGDVGGVGFMSQNPVVMEAGTSEDYLDIPWIVEEAHKRDIYLIGRMAVMRDNRLADAHPEWAAQSSITGGVWEDGGGLKWLDPFNPNVKAYNVGLAQEIANFGFDEVQFDYIRFPSDGATKNLVFSQPIDPENNPEVMYQAIGNVLKDAHQTINSAGAFFSIDVFGYATWRNMWEIGQSLEVMADHTDYVCPMVYPSHYDRNELGFDNADAHPYEIVKDSIEKGRVRTADKYALLRPWLQAFTATWLSPTVDYGRAEVRAQIKAVDEVEGTTGWTLWNAANFYDPSWLN